MTRTSTKKRLEANDADYCRFKGYEAGTTLNLLEECYRITAVGEEAILVRRVYRSREAAEVRWVTTLLEKEVISARPLEFLLRAERNGKRRKP